MFNENELKTIQVLVSRADIKGSEAFSVALLQQKINNLLEKQSEGDKKENEDNPEEKVSKGENK